MHKGANAKNFFHLLRLVVINILGVGTFVHILVTALTPSLYGMTEVIPAHGDAPQAFGDYVT